MEVSVTSRKAGGLGGPQGQVSPSRDVQGGPSPGAQGAPFQMEGHHRLGRREGQRRGGVPPSGEVQ
jgi:hypothetical protein